MKLSNANAKFQLEYFKHINYERRFLWQTEDPFVREREYATMRPLYDALKRLRAERGRTLRVLESGSGEGVNITHLGQMGLTPFDSTFEGVDVSPETVEAAKRHGLNVSIGNGLNLPFPDASFDAVYTHDVLHHLANDAERMQFFSEMKRVTMPGGVIVVIEPNPANPMIFALALSVKAERGLLTGSESHLTRLFPGSRVVRTCPSAAWRGWYHYSSPFRSWAPTALVTRVLLRAWESFSRLLPHSLWAWRVYVWE